MDRDPPLGWTTQGQDWPNRAYSRFIETGGLRWHVQVMGEGPAVVLVHGVGAASHSFAGLGPRLAESFRVIIPDLPGHGFTSSPPPGALSLPGMARVTAGLLGVLEAEPVLAVGHSAGAAIVARMALDRLIVPGTIVSLNGALLPTRGMPGPVSSTIARLLFVNPFVPWLFAWRAGEPRMVKRMLHGTGSKLDLSGVELYRRLARNPKHVAAAIGMMANWDLVALQRDLPSLEPELILMAAANDRMIRPGQAERVKTIVPGARIIPLPGLGHLAHEEQPQLVHQLIREATAASDREIATASAAAGT